MEKAKFAKDAPQDWSSARRTVHNGLLSVVMPAHNLEHSIADNIREVRKVFSGIIPFEIVVIDDGSRDRTADAIRNTADSIPELRPVFLKNNSGKGAALKKGFEASKGNFVLFLDADLDLPPGQTARFFEIMERESADVVIGSKQHKKSVLEYPWFRRITSHAYFFLVKLLIGLPVKDTQTGMKLFKRTALEWAFPRMLVKQFAFDLEMLSIIHEKGFRIAECPVILQFQTRWGMFTPRSVLKIMIDTLAIFYRLRLLRYYQSLPATRMPDKPPMVSIVIACPAPSAFLDECLEGIASQGYDNYEALVLPDKPSEKNWPAKVIEIPTGRIRPAEKRNIGIEKSAGELVAFIDDDAFPLDDWIQNAVVHFSDPSVAAVGGPASTPAKDPYLAQLSGIVLENPLVSGNYRYRYTPDRVRDVDDYPSCNLFARKEILQQLGGFRTDFWPGEDTYLCMEIVTKLKKIIRYEPRAHVCHHRRRLFLPHLRQIGRYALHRGYFAKRFPETSRRLSYAIPSLFVAGVIIGGIISLVLPVLRIPYFIAIGLYSTITLISCLSLNPLSWLITWLGVILTHFTYGTRFTAGLMAGQMPHEVAQFDHPSEKAGFLGSSQEKSKP
jgi:glycosyltransferase involved in cell wall biosynthesis